MINSVKRFRDILCAMRAKFKMATNEQEILMVERRHLEPLTY